MEVKKDIIPKHWTMRYRKLLVISFCLMPFLYACNDKTSTEEQQLLNSIEQTWQLCETSLPEAKTRAEGLRDSVRESSEYVWQKYDLLTIRLRDKYYMVPSSPDSAIKVMTYFEGRSDAMDKERACYYLGSAYRDLKDYPRAMRHFMEATDAARQSQCADTLIWQNALSQLRNLYMLQLNYEEELDVALQAVELAKLTRKNLGFYLIDAASAYEHLGDTLRLLEYCDKAYQVIQEEQFPPKYESHLAYILAKYVKTLKGKDTKKTDALLQHLLQLPEDLRPHNYDLSLATYYENANNTDSAIRHYIIYYYKAKTLSGRYEASAGLQRCYRHKGDLRQATEWGCRLYDTNDSIIAGRAFEETQRARDTYTYYRDKEKELAIMQRDEALARRSQRTIFVSIIALLCIVLGLTAFYGQRRKKLMEELIDKDRMLGAAKEEILRRKKDLEKKQQEIEQLGCQLEGAEQTILESKAQLENTMKDLEQRAMVNKELTRIALMNSATDKVENVIAHFREVATGRSSLGPNSWKELMTAIEALYPGFLENVQGRMKKPLREPLLQTICLMKIGLTLAQIAQVTDVTRQTAWNRMKRAGEICGDLLGVYSSARG